ncbi:MAG: primosomal protein N' [Eubacterium sp.]|nr:primosomal protein N' [Eubacterium sp.]
MEWYANIIIDISLEKLDRTFQYRVPENMLADIKPGMQVLLPFGKGNRQTTGYVMEVTDKAEFDPDKIKPILKLIPESITAPNQMLALAAWMRTNYGGTMNQALKTVLPVKKKEAEKETRMISLKMDREQATALYHEMVRKHQTARARLLEAVLTHGKIPYHVVTGKLNVTASVVRALEEAQMIRVERFRSFRNPLQGMKQEKKDITLSSVQQQIVEDIKAHVAQGDTRPCLIHGVTGSGKTEVYMELIASAIEQGKQAIVLIPEIALTFQTVMRFYNRFGDRVSILNSRMSAGERFDQYERAQRGEVDVMIGPRSALFTPFSNIGYIIIDEEHEATYKSETMPRYHARETAIYRASLSGGCVVLGSATPSVESYTRAKEGSFRLYELQQRVEERPLPQVYVEDLRQELRKGNRSILSDKLRELMEDRLAKKEQIMLFINRRGVAGFVSCRSCGHVIKCPHCDVSLSLHNNGKMICHYCGHVEDAVSACPSCGSKLIGTFKAGTQKIEAYLKEQFPQAGVLRMDWDTTRKKDSYEQILSAFANQEADILIGTQMIVKGHDFPNVTLVGVLAADLSLHVSDYRAAERTFQLLTQAAGRAGRGKRPGEVVIQTYQPENYAIQTAKDQDYQAFYDQEISFRQMLRYPPVWNLLVIHMAAATQEDVDAIAKKLAGFVKSSKGLQIIGPADPVIAKVNDIYRKVMYLKGAEYSQLISIKDQLEIYIKEEEITKYGAVQFDFNPMNGF